VSELKWLIAIRFVTEHLCETAFWLLSPALSRDLSTLTVKHQAYACEQQANSQVVLVRQKSVRYHILKASNCSVRTHYNTA
jgi:hypothetical protein